MEGTISSRTRTTVSKQAAGTSVLRVVHLLSHLRDLARRGGGYELRGVRGWATAADVAKATALYHAGENLETAFQRGELIREDVSVPDAASAVRVYRISEETARRIAQLEGVEHVPLQASGPQVEQRVYLRGGVITALDALRFAAENSTSRRARITDEPEWRTARELTGWLRSEGDRTGQERSFLSDDLAWAIKNGLTERRELPPPPNSYTSAPVVVYRITVTGAAVRPLVWYDPMSEAARGMDPRRLARFLEGAVDAAERARTLADLAELPNEHLDVFADAAAVLRANELPQPTLRGRVP